MKSRLLIGVLALLGFAVLTTSCDKLPQVELDAAVAAVETAKAAQADIYAAEAFNALQDSMKVANENIELQKSKLFKKYSVAKAQLIAVATLAPQVKQQAETKKAELMAEIDTTIAATKALIVENNELMLKAPKGKEGKAALEAMKSEIAVIEASLTEAANLQAAGNLFGSLDKAKAANAKATEINTELKEVTAKYTKAKRK
ncbi:MAG TPA: hypothetical protein DCQ26_15215 [Marinilabiliales bacterium]|jgi:photosystem II stability/assembly factor-like uncharacterized protein|nr:hypothetical protein [Salinivirgaceae bacterium]OFX48703.1 MAG: hypothetical protein A2W95_10955 [Bacteroidetes bacterium GWA2_40_14]OFX57123.1 MAG: hypothetical protein A2W84_13990 [Bacteroidetes bacterium GWC2_40_13]OFX73167.1 MAG: hypothetical protein A2W96_06910 [Bacteroidetes bacterium GWD2_40_43]OFX91722.1 MAG: hypothetical protein A2W97_07670 [Bacteroidetes bacterium GWE2_40_63]OFY24532.1 MAG: hypothetical protein A2W88_17090 [Bacteroidetes bacterium GWF2_40_13]OFZ23829.1 MAG: hypot